MAVGCHAGLSVASSGRICPILATSALKQDPGKKTGSKTFIFESEAMTRKETDLSTGSHKLKTNPLARLGALACLAVALAGCQLTAPDIQASAFQPSSRPITVDNVAANSRLAALAKAQHPRILATYGGEYSDPKLERMVAKVVGSLTTVSANPTQT